jgi:putative transposase
MKYPSSLTDREWKAIRSFFEYPNGYGNRRKHEVRHVLDAIFYVLKTGCQWRQLPHDFPSWKTVYSFYRRQCQKGIWEPVLDHLNAQHRTQQGRRPSPSYVLVDSQSVKTVDSGEARGFDGGKKNQGQEAAHRGGHGRPSPPRGSDGRQCS